MRQTSTTEVHIPRLPGFGKEAAMTEILVIDDEPEICAMIGEILELAGYQVREAHDGIEGISLCRARQPALVITDVVMPEMEGLELIRELSREMPETPILAISGAENLGIYLRAAGAFGASACMEKPFDPDDLLRAVEAALNHAAAISPPR